MLPIVAKEVDLNKGGSCFVRNMNLPLSSTADVGGSLRYEVKYFGRTLGLGSFKTQCISTKF